MSESAFDIKKSEQNNRTCIVCSKTSLLSEWVDDKCPACKQKYIPADIAAFCPNCGHLTKITDIQNERCEKCRT